MPLSSPLLDAVLMMGMEMEMEMGMGMGMGMVMVKYEEIFYDKHYFGWW